MSTNRRTIRTLSHCFYDLKYHIVWTPKYRGKVLSEPKVKQELRRILESICKWKQLEILELNVQDDHIHLVLLANPRYSISYLMQILKGKSSAWMRGVVQEVYCCFLMLDSCYTFAMSLNTLIMLAGAIVAVLPFLGFPHVYLQWILFAVGIFVCCLGIAVRRRLFQRAQTQQLPFDESQQ